MVDIIYKKGDVLAQLNGKLEQHTLCIHVCNDIGVMGAGIAFAIKQKYPKVYNEYMKWDIQTKQSGKRFLPLGECQFVNVKPDLVTICNMIGQHGVMGSFNSKPPIRYEAVDKCLQQVATFCQNNSAKVVGPKFGAGLAGGSWLEIEKLIIKNLSQQDISVTIYEL
jgi:O-acetyl-ADP-ribose deacetylase (regulator of RNase III)